jgi:hypothetical protein
MKTNAWGLIIASKHILVRDFKTKFGLPGLTVTSKESSKKELRDHILKVLGVEIEIKKNGFEFDTPETKDIFYVCSIVSGAFNPSEVAWINIPKFKSVALAQVEDEPVITHIINTMKTLERS